MINGTSSYKVLVGYFSRVLGAELLLRVISPKGLGLQMLLNRWVRARSWF